MGPRGTFPDTHGCDSGESSFIEVYGTVDIMTNVALDSIVGSK